MKPQFSMNVSWYPRILEAQTETFYTIDGEDMKRIRYGEEGPEWATVAGEQPCHDCGVFRGMYHVPGCDVERCPACGNQAITCDCDREDD